MNFSLLRNRAGGDARSIFRSPAGRAGLISIIVGAILIVIVTAVWVTAIFGGGPEAQNNSASPVADPGNQGVVTTLAGSGPDANVDEPGAADLINNPQGVAVDSSGVVYVADTGNQLIRKISPEGVVTTWAGSVTYDSYGYPGVGGFSDGTGTAARFNSPQGVAVDSVGTVYVADSGNRRIRKISPEGVVTTLAGSGVEGFADGTGAAAQFSYPRGVAVDSSGTVYVADSGNALIRKITTAGVVTTLASSGVAGYADGTGAAAQFSGPQGVAVDASGTVYIGDGDNNRIRKISPEGVVTTLAGPGGGIFGGAQFDGLRGVAVDSVGTVYVADLYNYRIRKISPEGVVTTLAGSAKYGHADGTGAAAQFSGPTGVAVDSYGVVYVADSGNNQIRKIR